MEDLLKAWDGDSVVVRYDRPTGAWMFIAIHDRTLGMAVGGCRMKVYPSPRDGLRDATRLAEGMTLKWAAIDFPFGGGKSVLAVPSPIAGEAREELLLRFGDLVESLGGAYGTGVDLGTTSLDMEVVGRRTDRVFGRRPEQGGSGDPGPWTALGVFAGLGAACGHVLGSADLEGRTVLIQGAGAVGVPLARRLAGAGARVLVTDAIPQRAEQVAEAVGGEIVAPEDCYDVECDVFSPCAIGAVLNDRSIPRLRCRIVAGSANNQLAETGDAVRMYDRGIVWVPDFVVNAGGAIAHGALEVLNWTPAQVESRIQEIGQVVGEILVDSERRAESPLEEAVRRARRVLDEARRNGTPAEATGYGTAAGKASTVEAGAATRQA